MAPNPSHYDVCPRSTRTHFLRVIGDRGLTEIRTITIQVGEPQHGGIGPAIPSLTASPATVSKGSRCTTLLWTTSGTDIARMALFRNDLAVAGPDLVTSFQDCVPDAELGRDIIYELRTESTLAACPGVDLIATVPGALSATSLLSRTQPDLLLLDATLAEEELEALLSWVKVRYPEIYCAALTASTRQRERVLGWGADVVVHRGDLTGQLQEILECRPA